MRLSAFPRALLDLVGSQNFGVNVKELSETISPVIDITPNYLSARLSTFAGIGTGAPASGFNLVHTVPAGKVWALFTAAASFSPEAGVAGDVGLAMIGIQNPNYRAWLTNWVTVAASTTKAAAQTFPQPLYVPPGFRLGAYLQNITGVPTVASSVEVNLLYVELNA